MALESSGRPVDPARPGQAVEHTSVAIAEERDTVPAEEYDDSVTIPPADVAAKATDGHWLELRVVCDAEAVEAVAELFVDYEFDQGIVVEEAILKDGDVDGFTVAPSKPVMVRTFLGSGEVASEELEDTRSMVWNLRQQLWLLGRSRPVGPLEVRERKEEDWPNTWKENFAVRHVGDRVVVKPTWHDYTPQPDEVVIELNPGTAFGTGLHVSTQLSMQALEAELKPGDRVIDVGTGTGVLAIAAALLGAREVDGVDIDPVAIRYAPENVEHNGVGGIVRVAPGSVGPGQPFQGPFDLVLANIIAPVLIELAPALAHEVAPGGTLILGGIIDFKEASVHEAFEAENLTLVRRTQREDWVLLVWRKPIEGGETGRTSRSG